MRIIRGVLAATAATVAALALRAAPAHADIAAPQPFYADSTSTLDKCPHGITSGTLLWVTPGPLPPLEVDVTGQLTDRPGSNIGVATCFPDDYNSTAIFTAYSGGTVVDSQSVTVDNDVAKFAFVLGAKNSTSAVPTFVDTVTVQVCRSPVHTLPPSYCGRVVTYGQGIVQPGAAR